MESTRNNTNAPSVSVLHFRQFKRNLKQLAKKYRHIKSDIDPVIKDLVSGHFIGDQLSGIGDNKDGDPYIVYKVRIANSDSNKGKRGGYRLIYEATDPVRINLLIIYCKADQGDIFAWEIQEILKEIERR